MIAGRLECFDEHLENKKGELYPIIAVFIELIVCFVKKGNSIIFFSEVGSHLNRNATVSQAEAELYVNAQIARLDR